MWYRLFQTIEALPRCVWLVLLASTGDSGTVPVVDYMCIGAGLAAFHCLCWLTVGHLAVPQVDVVLRDAPQGTPSKMVAGFQTILTKGQRNLPQPQQPSHVTLARIGHVPTLKSHW